jgi:hypothetical protein
MATTTPTIADADKHISNMPPELIDALVPYYLGGAGGDPVQARNEISTWISAGYSVRGIVRECTAGRAGHHPNQIRIRADGLVKALLDGLVGA